MSSLRSVALASAAASALVALPACSSVNAVSDFDPEVDFSAHRSSTWLDRTDAPEQAVNNPNPPSDRIARVAARLLEGFPPR